MKQTEAIITICSRQVVSAKILSFNDKKEG